MLTPGSSRPGPGPAAGGALPRVVLLTGASSGIGRATALRLARPGAVLALAARGREALEEVAVACRAAGARVSVHPLDVADDDAVRDAVADVARTHGRLDACVHAAALVAYGEVTEVPAEVFETVLRTNVLGTASVLRHVGAVLKEQGDGTLVVVGSVLGEMAAPWMASYGASKFAVHALARTLHMELLRSHPDVHVRVVAPGGVDTPVYRRAATYVGHHGRPPWPVYRPETVAERVAGVLARPAAARHVTQVGWANPLMVAGYRLLPGVFDRLAPPLMRVLGLDRRRVEDTAGNVLEPSGTSPASDGSGDLAPARRRTRAAR